MNDTASTLQFLTRDDGSKIAYHAQGGKTPGLIFLGGFMSDMTGSKANYLEDWARAQGRAFLRFDYFGHGQSDGAFTEGTIGRWAADAIAVLDHLSQGPQVLVGSSMGGWIMLLTALARPDRVAGLVGIAAAPDFTEDLMWASFDEEVRQTLQREGIYHQPSDYDDSPYPITLQLIEEGRKNLVMRNEIPITCPVRLLHGLEDSAVPYELALTLMKKLASQDVEISYVKSGDHRLSEPGNLDLLGRSLTRLYAQLEA